MPPVHDESDIPDPGTFWSPEAMLTFMYSRCQRRFHAATTEEKLQPYVERMELFTNVMDACRSGDSALRIEAVDHAMTGGRRIAELAAEQLPAASGSSSCHVNRVADAMLRPGVG